MLMRKLNLYSILLAVSVLSFSSLASQTNKPHLIEISALGVSSLDDSEQYVFFLEERGPFIKIANKQELKMVFTNNNDNLPLSNVKLEGFPKAKKGVSWEAIEVNDKGTQAFLLAEDSELGQYSLYEASVKYTTAEVVLTLKNRPIWLGEGRITNESRTVRAINRGGKKHNYDNWNHGFEAMAWFEAQNEIAIIHETSSIPPSIFDLNNNQAKNGELSNHHFRISDLTTLPKSEQQCLLGVSFCWNGDSSEICKSSPNESALYVFGMYFNSSEIDITAQSENMLNALGHLNYNAEGILYLDKYVYLINDSSAPKGTKTYLSRFSIDMFKRDPHFSQWLKRCSY
jgi:hypothetical protein